MATVSFKTHVEPSPFVFPINDGHLTAQATDESDMATTVNTSFRTTRLERWLRPIRRRFSSGGKITFRRRGA